MNQREERIYLWFEMWLQQKDLGIDRIFAENVVYIESWRPRYENRQTVKRWFEEWNTRGKVMRWDIKQFFHHENQTVVEWYFKAEMKNGRTEEFDGMSLIEWSSDSQIVFLKEFGCHLDHYNPYENSDTPRFRDEQVKWF